jgi:hypothetical protein
MDKTKTPRLWSAEHILKNSIYGDDVMGMHLYEMDIAIAEKIKHDMKIERELSKHGHLGNKQTKRK